MTTHYNNPLEVRVLKILKDGKMHLPEDMAEAHYGEVTQSHIVSVRLAISTLRKQGWIIEAAKQPNSNRKRGYQMVDIAANFERGFSGR